MKLGRRQGRSTYKPIHATVRVAGDDNPTINVRLTLAKDGEVYVHPDTVLELLRLLTHGSAADLLCTTYEAALRRAITKAQERMPHTDAHERSEG